MISGEVKMNQEQTQWYADMAKALKARDHAVRMISRWQQQLADSEHEVQKLSSMQNAATEVPYDTAANPEAATFTVD
jgi:hypothetical protein